MSRRNSGAYDTPNRNRWDRARFDEYVRSRSRPGSREREIDIRISDQRRDSDAASREPSRRPVQVDERERFVERDRFVGGADSDRRRDVNVYWEESTPSEIASRALAPYRRKELYEAPARPARPQYLRRQSSLDTFDRRPRRDYDPYYRPPVYVPVPVRRGPERYPDDDDWEEEYRDVRVRRRGHGKRHKRAPSVSSSSSSSSSDVKSLVSAKSGKSSRTTVSDKTIVMEEESVTLLGKKGKTRMPKRLVHKQVIIDMGLPFEEEDHFILVKRALLKEHIDDIIKRSETFRESNKVVYKFTEEIKPNGVVEEKFEEKEVETFSPPPFEIPPPPQSAFGGRGSVVEERRESIREDNSPSRHSGALTIRSRSQSHSHHRSDKSIRDEIRALEAERESLRLERKADRRLIEADRRRESDSYDLELVERRESRPSAREEVVTVGKDRRGKSKVPDPKAVAFALKTLI